MTTPTHTDALPELADFSERVYWLVAQIPSGKVATYGQIAYYAGAPRAARAVGSSLRKSLHNGHEGIPWQRVLNARGGISFKGDLGRAELQRRLLRREGVVFDDRFFCSLETYEWSPSSPFWGADW
ncbi:MAG: MGMT family protein [Myxococcota bacterium]